MLVLPVVPVEEDGLVVDGDLHRRGFLEHHEPEVGDLKQQHTEHACPLVDHY